MTKSDDDRLQRLVDILLPEIREILEKAKVGKHESASVGAKSLLGMNDFMLAYVIDIFMQHSFENPEELATSICSNSLIRSNDSLQDQIAHVRDALRYLASVKKVKGFQHLKEFEESSAEQEKPAKSEKVVEVEYNPGTSFAKHVESAMKADKDMDCIQKMAGLCMLLEKNYHTLYMNPVRGQAPQVLAPHLDRAATTLMTALEKLQKMQMDSGIMDRVPDKVDLTVNTVGSFQTYIGELDNESKDQMIDFAESFNKFVVGRRLAKSDNSSK